MSNRNTLSLIAVGLLSLSVLSSGCTKLPDQADLILVNGRVYTLDWGEPATDGTPAYDAPFGPEGWRPDAEAVAIGGGAILYVGSNEEAAQFEGPRTVTKDLDNAVVLPGLIESHVHIDELGHNLSRIDLRGLNSESTIINRLAEVAGDVGQDEWILGYGWDEGLWANRLPDHRLLSRRFPDNPVLLDGLHGFGVWVNHRAMELAGVTSATQSPSGGEIVKDPRGNPTGIFLNRAVGIPRSAVPPPTVEQIKSGLRRALRAMAADGYVAVHQAGTPADLMQAFQELEREDALPIRVYAMVSGRDRDLTLQWIERGPDTDKDSMLRVCAIKNYYDGSLGSRGARLLEDYSDMPGHRGVSGGEYGYDEELMAEAMEAGFQTAIHAIGDAGNREVLDFYERVLTGIPSLRENRHRIEHAQLVHPDDFMRFGEMGLIASMQPPQTVEDMAWLSDRVGPERARGAFAWRTLRLAGAVLTFNSDLPGSDHSIFYGLHAAITRRDRDLQPEEGWHPWQCVTPEEAVRAYTSWSAYAAFQEEVTGVLARGRFADITVMDVDPFVLGSYQPELILDGKILMTIVNGVVVHEAGR